MYVFKVIYICIWHTLAAFKHPVQLFFNIIFTNLIIMILNFFKINISLKIHVNIRIIKI